MGTGTNHVRTKDRGADHVLVNPWLTLKLTGWLASRYDNDHICRILSHRTASLHALFDVLVLDGGRGKTMNGLFQQKKDRDLDHAHVMGRDRTKVGGSTDALSSGARGKWRGFSPGAAARPLEGTRVMRNAV